MREEKLSGLLGIRGSAPWYVDLLGNVGSGFRVAGKKIGNYSAPIQQ
jgi:hypothetical protein